MKGNHYTRANITPSYDPARLPPEPPGIEDRIANRADHRFDTKGTVSTKPQPKKKNGYHHEAHEEHEGRKLFFSDSTSSSLSDLRGLRVLRGENVFREALH
jgi:hypothetical protein